MTGGGIEVTGTLPVTKACTPAAIQIRAKSRIGSKKLRQKKDLATQHDKVFLLSKFTNPWVTTHATNSIASKHYFSNTLA